jgi:hypothetical protein
MTRAQIEIVDPDPSRARDFIAQARRFVEDAEREATHLESAVVLYWNGCISAMDAVLTAKGRRIGRGEDGHAVRVEGVRDLLGGGSEDLIDRLDEWRRARHDVSYAAVTPSAADVAALQADARDMLTAAAQHVEQSRR